MVGSNPGHAIDILYYFHKSITFLWGKNSKCTRLIINGFKKYLSPPWQQCVKQCTDLWLWHQLELQIEAAVPQCPRYPNEKQCAEVFVAPKKEKNTNFIKTF